MAAALQDIICNKLIDRFCYLIQMLKEKCWMVIYKRVVVSFSLVRHSILYKSSESSVIYSVTRSPCWNASLFHSAVNTSLECGQGIFKVTD